MIRNLIRVLSKQSLDCGLQKCRLLKNGFHVRTSNQLLKPTSCSPPTSPNLLSKYQLLQPSVYRCNLGLTQCQVTKKPTDVILSQPSRQFHAAGSKVHYLDFRYRLRTNHLRLHLLIIRRQKMKKHRRRKFRRKFKALLAKLRLKREIAKEKLFRVELLSMIRKAENFDPKEYALQKIHEINNKPRELTKEERLEQLKQLIRENRYQVTYIKPKHRRADI